MTKHKRFGVPTSQFTCTKAVQRLTHLSKREKAVLVAMSDFYGTNGDMFASLKAIAKRVGCCRKTVQRAVSDLVDKGYLRRMTRQKSGRRNRSYVYALVVSEGQVSGLHVQAICNHVPRDMVTESNLNIPSEHIREENHLWIRWVEDHLLAQMDRVIDYQKTPRLVSMVVVSRWLFNGHKPEMFEQALIGLLTAAEHLKDSYLRNKRKLKAWKELLVLVKAPTLIDGTGDTDESDDDPLKATFIEQLPAHLRNDPKVRHELNSVTFEQSGVDLLLSSTSRLAIDRIMQALSAHLPRLAKAQGGKIVLMCQGQLVQAFG